MTEQDLINHLNGLKRINERYKGTHNITVRIKRQQELRDTIHEMVEYYRQNQK